MGESPHDPPDQAVVEPVQVGVRGHVVDEELLGPGWQDVAAADGGTRGLRRPHGERAPGGLSSATPASLVAPRRAPGSAG